MKKIFPVIVLVFACVFTACGKAETKGDIVLPSAGEVSEIEIVNGDVVTTTGDREVISNLIQQMATAKNTGKESINDRPNGDIACEISLKAKDGKTTKVFLYFERGNLLLEKPYEGIYAVDKSLVNTVNEIQ